MMHLSTVEPINVYRLAVGISYRKTEFDIHGHR